MANSNGEQEQAEQQPPQDQESKQSEEPQPSKTAALCHYAGGRSDGVGCTKKLLLCRRFKDAMGSLRNFNSLPLFVYATSSSTHAISADGVGVTKEAAAAAGIQNDSYDLALCNASAHSNNSHNSTADPITMDCLPLSSANGSSTHHTVMSPSAAGGVALVNNNSSSSGATTIALLGTAAGLPYQHHLHLHHLGGVASSAGVHHQLLATSVNHTPYSNNYPLHHSSSHHHIHSDQTKSLQELQHEVGALLEFRDLVIETFPDLKHKMASMSSSSTSNAAPNCSVNSASVSGTNTLTGSGGISNTSLVSRREWEPGIRLKRKVSQKEPSTSSATALASNAGNNGTANVAGVAGELSSSSLTRSRSNSHSGKKEPKSGENNNGSVVQDSGFSTETSSSKEGHSASSTNGAMTGALALNRLSCPESDDELLNLLDVIHRKSNRLREEMEHLQSYERQNLRNNSTDEPSGDTTRGGNTLVKSSSGSSSSTTSALTPKTFREHVERLNKEDIKQLRKERDRLLDKLAEMEAETLTGRIKAAKMNDQVEELISVKKDLEEQLKLAMAQKLELSSRVQQMQQQQQPLQSKSSSSQSDYSSQRNFLSSATTVVSTGSGASVHLDNAAFPPSTTQTRRPNTFQPVVLEQHQQYPLPQLEDKNFAFHQSAGSDSKRQQHVDQQEQLEQLGRLDGIVSTPGSRNAKCRVLDSKRFAAILLETNVIELQRHLLTLTVQNQVLAQKLDQASKSKSHLAKRLDKSKDDVEDLRFQLEEKNIELEGTKAQLRVLESRIHSSTPSSGAATNSYLHSQNDFETNRSSASTTLMLSRRGISSTDTPHYSDLRSGTPISQNGQMPTPNATQISTPSMKAMVHLPMEELQQHSSSTESAHDHELASDANTSVGRTMSTSVGGISPFEQARTHQQGVKRTGAGSKPSKIPLPGSKAAAYFAGKPPSGRPSTAGRSPPTGHAYTSSNASSKSSLSRSTGNLLYSKSPNSLKRADSAQSIRKDNSSMSTNTSRSSTSSSIPMATTPYATSKSPGSTSTPSARVLQNSPLPKLKRESLTSRVRHLDSLSRVHQHNSSVTSNGSDVSCTSPTSPALSQNNSSYMVSSTPKPSSIVAQINANVRKDAQLSANGTQQFLRRATGGAPANSVTHGSNTTRRFSSASVVGARIAGGRQQQQQQQHENAAHNSTGSNGEQQQSNGVNGASDSDSGKHSLFYEQLPLMTSNPPIHYGPVPTPTTPKLCPPLAWQIDWQNNDYSKNIKNKNTQQQSTNHYAQMQTVPNVWQKPLKFKYENLENLHADKISTQIYQNPHYEMDYNNGTLARLHSPWTYDDYDYDVEEEEMPGAYYSNDYSSYGGSTTQGSDNLLVTFDYGYCDSLEADIPPAVNMSRMVYAIKEEGDELGQLPETNVDESSIEFDATAEVSFNNNDNDDDDEEREASIWFNTTTSDTMSSAARGMTNEVENVDDGLMDVATAFKVHHVQHELKDSVSSLLTTFSEYEMNDGERRGGSGSFYEARPHMAMEDSEEEEDEEEEEQFYDSLEDFII